MVQHKLFFSDTAILRHSYILQKMPRIWALLGLLLIVLVQAHDSTLAVDLRQVHELVFRSNAFTNPIAKQIYPQLVCKNDGMTCDVPREVMCFNIGHDGRDVLWHCETNHLPQGWVLNATEVICQGYPKRDSLTVLVDGCSLEYTVSKVAINTMAPSGWLSSLAKFLVCWLLFTLFVGVIVVIVMVWWNNPQQGSRRATSIRPTSPIKSPVFRQQTNIVKALARQPPRPKDVAPAKQVVANIPQKQQSTSTVAAYATTTRRLEQKTSTSPSSLMEGKCSGPTSPIKAQLLATNEITTTRRRKETTETVSQNSPAIDSFETRPAETETSTIVSTSIATTQRRVETTEIRTDKEQQDTSVSFAMTRRR